MSDLGIALAGIEAGSLATGALEVMQASREQRLRSRAAARLLILDLNRAGEWIRLIVERQGWPSNKNEPDFTHLLATWREHREAFAGGSSAIDWLSVSDVCPRLTDLTVTKRPGEPLTTSERQSLEHLIKKIRHAEEKIRGRSFTRREKRQYMKTPTV